MNGLRNGWCGNCERLCKEIEAQTLSEGDSTKLIADMKRSLCAYGTKWIMNSDR